MFSTIEGELGVSSNEVHWSGENICSPNRHVGSHEIFQNKLKVTLTTYNDKSTQVLWRVRIAQSVVSM